MPTSRPAGRGRIETSPPITSSLPPDHASGDRRPMLGAAVASLMALLFMAVPSTAVILDLFDEWESRREGSA